MFATITPPRRRLLVFARLPELGKVKTRLAQSIGPEKALAVYEAMLRDLLASIGAADETLEIEIVWAPTSTANAETLHRAFGDRPLAMQTGANLGDRLAMAFSERFFFHRTETIVAIGVDEPRLPRQTIDDAFELLEACEWVVGPARDGGYYLIGCRGPALDSAMFRDIEWGSSSVLSTTLQRIREREQSVALLPVRYDIDVEEDLRRFAAEKADGSLMELLRIWGWAA